MFMVVVRREPDRGYYFTAHDGDGGLLAISKCWATKSECDEYLRSRLPPRVRVEDDTC
jgi:hypothetical protein